MLRTWICTWKGPLLLVWAATTAWGTSFYQRPFTETVQESSILVRGKTGKSSVEWTALSDGSKQLFTYTDLTVEEVLKGKVKPGLIRIRELGGERDGVGLQISGAAGFSAGEDVVLILDEPIAPDEAYPLQGMMMGKLTVEKGADGTEYLRGPVLRGQHVHAVGGHEAEEGPQTQWSLAALRELIRKQSEKSPSPTGAVSKSPADDGLLKSRSKPLASPNPGDLTSAEPVPSRKRRTPSGWVIVFGALAGVVFFVWSRKRDRRKKGQ